MKQAAISATRSLRSALDTRLLPSSSWTPSSLGVSGLGSVRTHDEEASSLTSRLSGRLNSNSAGSLAAPQPSGSRSLSTRAKKRRTKKTESKRVDSNNSKLRVTVSKATRPQTNIRPQWTAVSAALSSLEESIAKTNLLLHSLASGSAWARRTQPRAKWSEKETLDLADKRKKLASAQITEALAALLQELGQKQAAAVNLLSRLNEAADAPRPIKTGTSKTFEDVLVKNACTGSNEITTNTQTPYESGWGPDGKPGNARSLE